MMQGLAGWQSLTGEPGGPPTKSVLSLVDLSGGYASAIAIMAGIGVHGATAPAATGRVAPSRPLCTS